jgi:DNA-directed RNA polymerase specialized sigma24 family protein
VRYHRWRHGRDATESACCLAAVEAWDVWDEPRGPFDKLVLTAARSRLWAEVKCLRRPPLPLEDWAVTDPADHTAKVEARELVGMAMRERHRDTLAAVADEYTLVDAAKRLGVSRETVRRRLLEVRDLLLPAAADVDETSRGDVIVTK